MIGVVDLYLPQKLYGFCTCDPPWGRMFFHTTIFTRLHPSEVPPITGERVDVKVSPTDPEQVLSVLRLDTPVHLEGFVKSFDDYSGWGFIRGDDARDYFLHRSEVCQNRLPTRDQRVRFYRGFKNGKPRACYIEV